MKNGIVVSKKELDNLIMESAFDYSSNPYVKYKNVPDDLATIIDREARKDPELQFFFQNIGETDANILRAYASCSPAIQKACGQENVYIGASINNLAQVWMMNFELTRQNASLFAKSEEILRIANGNKYVACNLWKLITNENYEYCDGLPKKVKNKEIFKGEYQLNINDSPLENECRFTNWQFLWLLSQKGIGVVNLLNNEQVNDVIARQKALLEIKETFERPKKDKDAASRRNGWIKNMKNSNNNNNINEDIDSNVFQSNESNNYLKYKNIMLNDTSADPETLLEGIEGLWQSSINEYISFFGQLTKKIFQLPPSMRFIQDNPDNDYDKLGAGGEYGETYVQTVDSLEDSLKNARKKFGLDKKQEFDWLNWTKDLVHNISSSIKQ